MDFNYDDYFGATPSTGYETLLYDAMKGDSTLFQRGDAVEAGWQVLQPVLDVWAALPARDFPNYPRRLLGPAGGGRVDGARRPALGGAHEAQAGESRELSGRSRRP